VARVSQKELRQILGGQFAAKEGEQLIKRAFNPGQDEGENVLRVESLLRQLEARREEIAASLQGGPPVRVDSPEAAALLPSGSRFLTPDGQVRVKR